MDESEIFYNNVTLLVPNVFSLKAFEANSEKKAVKSYHIVTKPHIPDAQGAQKLTLLLTELVFLPVKLNKKNILINQRIYAIKMGKKIVIGIILNIFYLYTLI